MHMIARLLEVHMQLVMGVEGRLVLGCTEPGPPEAGLQSGNLKVLGVKC